MKRILSFFLLILSPCYVHAHTTPNDLPTELIYRGQPIDSLCLHQATVGNGTIALTHCGLSSNKNLTLHEQDKEFYQPAYIGYDYQWTMSPTVTSHGYSYYKPLGTTGNAAVVHTINSDGGRGQFSTISLIKRDGDQIKVTTLNNGDRCNNGIFDVKHDPHQPSLSYHVNLTAFDFLTLTNNNPHHLKAYDNLESCAACCKAVAIYQRNLAGDIKQEKLLYVDLDRYPTDISNLPKGDQYQICFNHLLEKYKKQGKHHLNPEQLVQFTNTFNTQCVKTS